MGFITMTRFNSGFKLNPGLKPNLKPDQINWVLEDFVNSDESNDSDDSGDSDESSDSDNSDDLKVLFHI